MATIDAYLDELLGTAPSPMTAAADMLPAVDAVDATAPDPQADAARAMDACDDVRADAPADATADAPRAASADAIHADVAGAAGVHADVAGTCVVHADAVHADRAGHHAATGNVRDIAVAVFAAPSPTPAVAMPRLSGFEPVAPIAPIPRAPIAPTGRARTATGGNRWLRVCVGRDSYAFELLRVQEVVRLAPIVAMRGAAHAVLGVMNLRGRIVPVFDLGLWLDVGAVQVDERARIVVIERDDELIGVLVTCVEDVVSLEREHVEPPLPGTDPGPTLGVARVTDAPTVLLDADALFD